MPLGLENLIGVVHGAVAIVSMHEPDLIQFSVASFFLSS